MAPSAPHDATQYPQSYLDEYVGTGLVATSIALIVLELLLAALRLYARKVKKAQAGVDDWFIWPALLANLALCVEVAIMVPLVGVGHHLVAMEMHRPETLSLWHKMIFANVWLWALAVALPKLAILGFYLRFFKVRMERLITYGLMAIISVTFFVTGITTTLQCKPIAYQWDRSIPGGKCFNVLAFYRWMSFPNILTDVIMLLLPLPMIWGLHVSRTTKFGITLMFLTGSVGIISSCLRFVTFFNHDAFEDETWTSVPLLAWTVIESAFYFIAACMPSLRPAFQHIWKRTLSSNGSRDRGSQTVMRPDGRPRLELAKVSFNASTKNSGFERIVTAEGTKEGESIDWVAQDTKIPWGGIGVKEDVKIEHHPGV